MHLTLDTACVIHAVQQQAYGREVDELVDLARAGKVDLSLTSAFPADQSRASAEHQRDNQQWLSQRPVIGRVPGPFRLDYSTLDGPDVLVNDDQLAVATEIEEILLPPELRPGRVQDGDSLFMDKWQRRINDSQHLTAHFMAGHDAFVTSDDGILKKRDYLRVRASVVVLTPPEVVAMVRAASGS
jgi:hypothetical protein